MKIKSWGEIHEVQPRIELYSVLDFMGNELYGIAILLEEDREPFCDLTVSFGEFIGMKDCAYVDTNNCPFADQLLQMDIAEDTGFTKRSGFCEYPLWHFNENFLKQHGSANYKMYSDTYEKYMGNR